MSLMIIIALGTGSTFIAYQLGKYKGVNEYHKHLVEEVKVFEKKIR